MSDFEVKQEEDVLPGKTLLLIFGGTLVAALIWVGVAWFALELREAHYRPGGKFPEAEIKGHDVLSGVEQTLIELRDHGAELTVRKRQQLDSYGWVDLEKRVVRIPIERAMDLVAGEVPKQP